MEKTRISEAHNKIVVRVPSFQKGDKTSVRTDVGFKWANWCNFHGRMEFETTHRMTFNKNGKKVFSTCETQPNGGQ